MNLLYALTAALAVLQALDYYTTTKAINSGKGHEANPIAKKLMDAMGMDTFLIVKGVTVIVLGYYAGVQSIWLLGGIVGFYNVIIINNFRVIHK